MNSQPHVNREEYGKDGKLVILAQPESEVSGGSVDQNINHTQMVQQTKRAECSGFNPSSQEVKASLPEPSEFKASQGYAVKSYLLAPTPTPSLGTERQFLLVINTVSVITEGHT